MTRCPHKSRFVWAVFALLGSAGFVADDTRADQISLDGIAVPGIEILAIRDGELIYLIGGAERSSPLTQVSDLRIDAHPTYTQAVNFLKAGQARDAAGMLRNVLRNANRDEAWLKQFASWRLVQALDAQGVGEETAAAFAALVGIEPDPFFLTDPPTRSLASLEGEPAARAREHLERAKRRAGDDALAAIDQLLAVLDGQSPVAADPADDPGAGTIARPAVESAVALPATLGASDDPAVILLRSGRFADAITLLDSQMRSDPGRLQQRTFLKALGMLKLAEATDDRNALLDAGLQFMRVVAMARDGSAYLGPALLEAGVVHRAIGADDLADALFEEASLLIDEQDEPDYFRRYAQLTGNRP